MNKRFLSTFKDYEFVEELEYESHEAASRAFRLFMDVGGLLPKGVIPMLSTDALFRVHLVRKKVTDVTNG